MQARAHTHPNALRRVKLPGILGVSSVLVCKSLADGGGYTHCRFRVGTCVPDVAAELQRGREKSCFLDSSADVSLDDVMQKALDLAVIHEQSLFAG